MSENGVSASEVAALAQRVTGVEKAVEANRRDNYQLDTKLDDKSKTPWGTILAGATLLFTVITAFGSIVGSVVAWGILSKMENTDKRLDTFQATYENNRVVNRQDVDAKFAEMHAQQARSVPREEHQQIWLSQANTDKDQQRQIDEVKNQLSSLYGARDFFKDVQERLDRLERRQP